MTPFLRKLLGQNWLLLLIMLALAISGVVAIYSATSTPLRSVRDGFLAQAGKLGRRGCFRIHADEFGSLPLDPLGRPSDVSGRYRFSHHDEVHMA